MPAGQCSCRGQTAGRQGSGAPGSSRIGPVKDVPAALQRPLPGRHCDRGGVRRPRPLHPPPAVLRSPGTPNQHTGSYSASRQCLQAGVLIWGARGGGNQRLAFAPGSRAGHRDRTAADVTEIARELHHVRSTRRAWAQDGAHRRSALGPPLAGSSRHQTQRNPVRLHGVREWCALCVIARCERMVCSVCDCQV